MRPLRRRPFLGHLALFALAIELIASFAHVHAHPAAQQVRPLASRIFYAPASGPCLPGLHDHLECSICAAMNLLASSDVPEAAPDPGMALRLAVVLSEVGAERVAPKAAAASFQARAPPGLDLA